MRGLQVWLVMIPCVGRSLCFLLGLMLVLAHAAPSRAGLTLCNPTEDSLAVAVANGKTVTGWFVFDGQACKLVIESDLTEEPVQISVVSNSVHAQSVLGGDYFYCVLWLRRFSLAQDDACTGRGRRLLGFFTVPVEGEVDMTYTLPKARFGSQIASTSLNLKFYGHWKPNITFSAADGSTVDIAEFRGKWVLLLFWADWCPPCITALTELNGLRKALGGERVAVVAVHSAESDSRDLATRIFREKGIESIGLYFENANFRTPRSLAQHLGAIESKGAPSLSILDPEGRMVAAHEGELTEPLLAFLAKLFGSE